MALSLGAQVVMQSREAGDLGAAALENVESHFAKKLPSVPWSPFPRDYLCFSPIYQPHKSQSRRRGSSSGSGSRHGTSGRGNNDGSPKRVLTLCDNSSDVCRFLQHVSKRASEMCRARAYVHWYDRYGTGVDDITEAVETVHGIVRNYHSMCSSS